MNQTPIRCLILACGNTLRSDDGVGPWLAQWAEDKFREDPAIRVVSRQQWTPDLAEDVAQAASVLFIDCSVESAQGSVRIVDVQPSEAKQGLATHHVGAPELLALARELYNALPRHALLLTIGAGSTELGEIFSALVLDAIPHACGLLESTILEWSHDRASANIPPA
jgi:hydrogenase maturation protease